MMHRRQGTQFQLRTQFNIQKYIRIFPSLVAFVLSSIITLQNQKQKDKIFLTQEALLLLCPKPYKHPKTTKLNFNTPWMNQIYKKTTNIDYYFFLPSMKHSRFMEVQYNCQLLCLTHLSGLSIPIFDIPCHFQSLCICKTS